MRILTVMPVQGNRPSRGGLLVTRRRDCSLKGVSPLLHIAARIVPRNVGRRGPYPGQADDDQGLKTPTPPSCFARAAPSVALIRDVVDDRAEDRASIHRVTSTLEDSRD